LELKTSYGVAVRTLVYLTNDFELYGRLGSVRAKSSVKVSYSGRSESESNSSTHTLNGVGLAFKMTENLELVADYTKRLRWLFFDG
jgi:outer membrane autotransporter protein